MRYGSLFSGIGGFDLGFDRAGMECAWQVEFDRYPRQVLEARWPGATKHEDVRNVGKKELGAVDVICGGFPCQDVSVAGNRAGLDGERSGLWFEFRRILAEVKPAWVVIENVPGLLSSNGGRDFATILRGLVELRYGVCWRILDAQYFGVAQRRRRVFVVGHLGSGRAAQVLFEPKGGGRDSGAGGKAGRTVAAITASGAGTSRTGNQRTEADMMIVDDYPIAMDVRNMRAVPDSKSGPLQAKPNGGHSLNYQNPVFSYRSPTMTWGGSIAAGVRRLTPVECERLQGFPDNWTEGLSDARRYKALGNAVCVPVAEWIGRRLVLSQFDEQEK